MLVKMVHPFFLHPPTFFGGKTAKGYFIYGGLMSKMQKIAVNLTFKKQKYIYKIYSLVKRKMKVLLLFYFCSTYKNLLLLTTLLYTIILYYTILYCIGGI